MTPLFLLSLGYLLGCVVTRHQERTREQRGVVRAAERVLKEVRR